VPIAALRDLLPQTDEALAEVLAGLSRRPKGLPAKYFYDDSGSALFERICELPEYYLTRAELQVMERHVGEMAALLGPGCELIEFGCGSGRKTRLLVEALRPPLFVPIDISRAALESACGKLAATFPDVLVSPILADYTRPIDYPAAGSARISRRAVYFPGSTVGNLSREEAAAFLAMICALVGPGGALLIGVDLKKDPAVLHAAYNDAEGVTAAFNLNMLAHLNRRFGANFDLTAFAHVAFYDEALGRIEMHLRSTADQTARIGGRSFTFARGEAVRTEISCKYDMDEFRRMGADAGFSCGPVWFDPQRLFSVFAFVAA
jgi:dimethylhistidine N-methyltransferase